MEAASSSLSLGRFGARSPVSVSSLERGGSAGFSLDAGGTVTRWSDGAESLLGWPAREVLGRSMAFLVPPERADEQERIMRQCARHGRPERLMTQRLHKDGSRVDILLTLLPVHDSGRRLTAVLGQAHAAGSPEARAREFERIVVQLTAMTDVALAVGGETSPERVLDLIAERGRALVGGRGLVILRGLGSRVTVAAGGDSENDLRGARLLCPGPLVDKLLADPTARCACTRGRAG